MLSRVPLSKTYPWAAPVLFNELHAGQLQRPSNGLDRLGRNLAPLSLKIYNSRKSQFSQFGKARLRHLQKGSACPTLSRTHFNIFY